MPIVRLTTAQFLVVCDELERSGDRNDLDTLLLSLGQDLDKLDGTRSGLYKRVVREAQAHDWLLPLIILLMPTSSPLRDLYLELVARLRADAPADHPTGNHLVTASTQAPSREVFAAELTQWLLYTGTPAQVWQDNGDDLLAADLLLLVLSSTGSESGRHDVRRAREMGMDVIAVRVDPHAHQPEWAADLDCVEAHGPAASRWKDLERRLRAAGSAERQLASLVRRREQLFQRLGEAGARPYVRRLDEKIERIRAYIADPDAAEARRTDAIEAIDAGRARDRGPDPAEREAGPLYVPIEPPVVPDGHFQDRDLYLAELVRMIGAPDVPLIALLGPPGNGKTGLMGRLLHRLRAEPDLLDVEAFIYLPVYGYRPVNAPELLRYLVRMLPADHPAVPSGQRRSAHWRDRLDVVLDALGRRGAIVVIDNAEALLDGDGRIDDPELRDLVDHLVRRGGHRVTTVLVAQPGAAPPLGATPLRLDEGLEHDYALEFLKVLAEQGHGPLDGTSQQELDWLIGATHGVPRALELAYGLLEPGRGDTISSVITFAEEASNAANVVPRLLARTVERLEIDEKRAVQALAVFGRPVSAAAVDYLLDGLTIGAGSAAALAELHERRLIRRDFEDGRPLYFTPPTDRECLLDTIPSGHASFDLAALRERAGDYFAATRRPDDQIIEVHDLRAHLAEIDLRLEAGDAARAMDLIREINARHLQRMGHGKLLVRRLEGLAGSFDGDGRRELRRLCDLVWAHEPEHDPAEVLYLVRKASRLALRRLATETLFRLLPYRAQAHHRLGEARTGDRLYRLALLGLLLDGRYRPVRATTYLHLAMSASRMGRFRRMRRLLARADRLAARADDPQAVERRIAIQATRGQLEVNADRYREAEAELTGALRLADEARSRPTAASVLIFLAHLLLDHGNSADAVRRAEEAARIGMEIGNRSLAREANEILTLACLHAGDDAKADEFVTAAVRHDATAQGYIYQGMIRLRQREPAAAEQAFTDASELLGRPAPHAGYHEFDLLGLATGGVALARAGQNRPAEPVTDRACREFRTARRLTRAPGVIRRLSMLLDQFEPAGDPAVLARLRRAAGVIDR
ncbi:AAA family ATPase [Dactylosporangium sp. CS-047395]|uniref:ATP-binding protein n=1 Tax=Dactylosporangium sp. CS-047395 TaxID=3239936 RepID=UPI003D8FB0E6